MKYAKKITYEYHYWFITNGRDRWGSGARKLFKDMCRWLENTLDVCDYSAKDRYGKFTIDFRNEDQYTFFALCWDSVVADYHESYNAERY